MKSAVGNKTDYIYADECTVEVILKTPNTGYLEAIDYIHKYLEEEGCLHKVQILFLAFEDQVER